jgi:hypothetical protein
VTFLSNEKWWSLPFVDIKLDGQVILIMSNGDLSLNSEENKKSFRI